jgi:hypothetical protein
VPKFSNDSESDEIDKSITLEEVKENVSTMLKDKIRGPDAWTLQAFFDIIGVDLHKVVEEPKCTGIISGALNATFFALICKVSKPYSFHYFRPIALCNFVYKVISKNISTQMEDKLA